MLKLLAKQAAAKEQQQKEEEEGQQQQTNERDEDKEQQPDAGGTEEANSTQPTKLTAAGASSDSFDLSASPLGQLTSFSSSLINQAQKQLTSAVHVGGDAAKLLHQQVKRGMKKSVAGIERATRTNQLNKDGDDMIEADEHDVKSDWEQKYDEDDTTTSSAHHLRRDSWSKMKNSVEDETQTSESKEEPFRASTTSPTHASSLSTASTASSPSLSAAAPFSTSSDLTLLRMNFLRLLHRCEEISRHHLHPTPGTTPILHPVQGQPTRTAKCFFKFVSILQHDYLPQFRERRAVIQPGKENHEFMRRVAFLATLSEKESQHVQSSFVTRTERKVQYPSWQLKRRTTSAATANQDSTVTAAASSSDSSLLDSSSSVWSDTSLESLLHPEPAPVLVDRGQELRALLFAKQQQQQRDTNQINSIASSKEFSAEREQRQLMGELHEMTDSLKTVAKNIGQALATDAQVLSQVDGQLDDNLHSITHENSRLKKWASTGCSEMCWNIVMILTLWIVFIAMFIFMKIFPAPK